MLDFIFLYFFMHLDHLFKMFKCFSYASFFPFKVHTAVRVIFLKQMSQLFESPILDEHISYKILSLEHGLEGYT